MFSGNTLRSWIRICIFVPAVSLFAQNNGSSFPEVEILQSKYVRIDSVTFTGSRDSTVLEAAFTILGKAVYGHFDCAAFNDSGLTLVNLQSDDRAYRDDKGFKPKTVRLAIGDISKFGSFQVSFHEMRLEPDRH